MPRFIHLTGKKRYGTKDFGPYSLFMRNPKMISKQTFRIDNTFTLDDVSSNFILNTFRFFHYLDYDTISMSFPLHNSQNSNFCMLKLQTNRSQFFELFVV